MSQPDTGRAWSLAINHFPYWLWLFLSRLVINGLLVLAIPFLFIVLLAPGSWEQWFPTTLRVVLYLVAQLLVIPTTAIDVFADDPATPWLLLSWTHIKKGLRIFLGQFFAYLVALIYALPVSLIFYIGNATKTGSLVLIGGTGGLIVIFYMMLRYLSLQFFIMDQNKNLGDAIKEGYQLTASSRGSLIIGSVLLLIALMFIPALSLVSLIGFASGALPILFLGALYYLAEKNKLAAN